MKTDERNSCLFILVELNKRVLIDSFADKYIKDMHFCVAMMRKNNSSITFYH